MVIDLVANLDREQREQHHGLSRAVRLEDSTVDQDSVSVANYEEGRLLKSREDCQIETFKWLWLPLRTSSVDASQVKVVHLEQGGITESDGLDQVVGAVALDGANNVWNDGRNLSLQIEKSASVGLLIKT